VSETMSTPACETSASPSSGPGPLTVLSTPSGSAPDSAAATVSTVAGQVGGVLTTTGLPASSAGTALLSITATGQLKGRMAATTPCGSRLTTVAPAGLASRSSARAPAARAL